MSRNRWNAKKIKKLREQLGLTQRELAEKLEVAENTVTRWEMGIVGPDKWNQYALSQIEESAA